MNTDNINRQQIGKDAEHYACEYLQTKGLGLIIRNYHCYHGEIDLIMQDKDDIVFVEVRSRSRSDYGSALESINKSKQKKLIKTAIHFLQCKKWLHRVNSRFDVIAIQLNNGSRQLDWIKNAFSVEK